MKNGAAAKVLQDLENEHSDELREAPSKEDKKAKKTGPVAPLGGNGYKPCDCHVCSGSLLETISRTLCGVIAGKELSSKLSGEKFGELVEVHVSILKRLIG